MTVTGRMSAFYGRRRATESQHGLFLACATGAQGKYPKARLPDAIVRPGAGPHQCLLGRLTENERNKRDNAQGYRLDVRQLCAHDATLSRQAAQCAVGEPAQFARGHLAGRVGRGHHPATE